MKVLHVIDALGMGGGAEHSLAAILPELRKRGVVSTLACLDPRVGGLEERLRSEGFPVTLLSGRTLFGKALALRRLIRSAGPDLVHATLVRSCLVARFASVGFSRATPGPPLVNSLVNTPYDPVRVRQLRVARWKLAVLRTVDGMTARHLVERFHAVSGAVADAAAADLGIDRERITVVYRGRPVTGGGGAAFGGQGVRTEIRRALDLSGEAPVLLNVGRQDHQKAQAVLVRALPEILEEHPGAVAWIAGRDGSASEELAGTIESLGLASKVRLLGHREDVRELLEAADLFVFPSLYEGVGGAAIEAMAVGLPVVAADIPPMREVVGGECGVLTPPGEPEPLAIAVSRLLADDDRRKALGAAGRRRFLERHDLEVIADATVALYREVLSETR